MLHNTRQRSQKRRYYVDVAFKIAKARGCGRDNDAEVI